MKNTALKYTMMLLEFLILGVFIHFATVAPLIDIFCLNYTCSNLINTFTLMIVEPVLCIVIVVFLINKKEKQYYDSIS